MTSRLHLPRYSVGSPEPDGERSVSKLECIVCKKQLENIMEERGVQPDSGLSFLTYGHYGSTVFDPMDGSFIEIVVCDDCVQSAIDNGRVYRP